MRATDFISHHIDIQLDYDKGEVSLSRTDTSEQKAATCACKVFAHSVAGQVKSTATAPRDLKEWIYIKDFASTDGYTYDIFIPRKEFKELSKNDQFFQILESLSDWEVTSQEPADVKQKVIEKVLDAFEKGASTLDLSHLGLKEPPVFLFHNQLFQPILSSSLDLSHNQLTFCHSLSYAPIENLNLSHNQLRSLDTSSAKSLKSLDISYNETFDNHGHGFQIEEKWESVNVLGCHKLREVGWGPSSQTPSLKYFSGEHLFGTVNQFIEKFSHLEYLEVRGGWLDSASDKPAAPNKNLKHLILLDSKFSQHNQEDTGEEALERLFTSTPTLETFGLINSDATKLPVSIADLPLKKLTLAGTKIENLSELIENMKHLEYLDVSNCGLQELPDSTGDLRLLQTLNIANNHLDKLPKSFKSLDQLKELDISDNPIAKKSLLDYPDYLKEQPFIQKEGDPRTPPTDKVPSYSIPEDHLFASLPPQLSPDLQHPGKALFKVREKRSQSTEKTSTDKPLYQTTDPLMERLGTDLYSRVQALCFKKKQALPKDDESLKRLLMEIDKNCISQIAKLEKTKKTSFVETNIAHEKHLQEQIRSCLEKR